MTDFYKKNDNLLRDKLTQHEFSPTPGAWDSMSQMLDKQPIANKAAGIWWWSIPIVAASALTGIISLGIYLNPETTQESEKSSVIHLTEQNINSNNNSSKPILAKKSERITEAPVRTYMCFVSFTRRVCLATQSGIL